MKSNVVVINKEESQLTDSKAILQSRIDKAKNICGTLKVDFVLLGGYLNDLKPYVHEVWSDRKGRFCKDIFELSQQEFNLCKTTVKNVIGVATRFGYLFTSIKDEFKEYNYSQLVEMLPLSDEQIKLVSPDMTQQEIRALKKAQIKKSQLTDQNENPPLNPLDCLLVLTNDKQRLEFLGLYESWGVWLEVPELNLKFYKCDLNNGDMIVVTRFCSFLSESCLDYEWRVNNLCSIAFRIIKKGTSPTYYGYSAYANSDSEYLSYLKSTKAKIVCTFECKTLEEYKKKIELIKRGN